MNCEFVELSAAQIYNKLGEGWRLRVPLNGSAAELVWPPKYVAPGRECPQPIGPLLDSAVMELLTTRVGWLHKMSMFTENQRLGVRDLGLDGNGASLYSLMQ